MNTVRDRRPPSAPRAATSPTNAELENEGKYVLDDDAWWVRTGHPTYDPAKFYAVTAIIDPFSNLYSTSYDAHALLVVGSTDPLGNTVSAEHDYRLLGPWQLTDQNGNRSQVQYDLLGLVERSAVMGKVGDDDGDTLDDPTTTFEYDLSCWQTTGAPNWGRSRVRETHQNQSTRWLEQRSYFSGAGGVAMVKAQTRPGLAPQRYQPHGRVSDERRDAQLGYVESGNADELPCCCSGSHEFGYSVREDDERRRMGAHLQQGPGRRREIVIDARGTGLSEELAKQGAGRALGISRGKLDGLSILGDGYFFRWTPR